ncbi:MAG: S-ribosylhomocysteine lyase [Clostridia bacterium]|nr:S-ribosylhomocysteine lyase [Clostridia bacterium]
MQKIASFTVDHNLLDPGIYVSRRDGDITTYDLRTRKPNCGDYMDNLTMHSVEHLFATFVRNSAIKDSVIYFGPMGCQTGFYLLTKDVPDERVLEITMEILEKIVSYDGEMPGNTAVECGNYRNLNVDAARLECARYLDVLKNRVNDFRYREA